MGDDTSNKIRWKTSVITYVSRESIEVEIQLNSLRTVWLQQQICENQKYAKIRLRKYKKKFVHFFSLKKINLKSKSMSIGLSTIFLLLKKGKKFIWYKIKYIKDKQACQALELINLWDFSCQVSVTENFLSASQIEFNLNSSWLMMKTFCILLRNIFLMVI